MGAGKLDEYAVKARVFPAFLALLPLGACLSQFLGLGSLLMTVASGLGGTTLFSFVLAQWGRDAGKQKELELFALWGGRPTTTYLRHNTVAVNGALKVRRRERLEKLSRGLVLPTLRAEAEDPLAADQQYEMATRVLIQRTRDKTKFSLLFQELIDYGFRRNTWGLKKIAIALNIISLAACLLLIALRLHVMYNAALSVLLVLLFLAWCFFVNPGWVYRSAATYSERLFDSLDMIEGLD